MITSLFIKEMNNMIINTIVFSTHDLEASKQFYDLLDMSFHKEQHNNGPIHYSCNINGIILELYPATFNFPAEKSTRLGIEVNNLKDIENNLLKFKIPMKKNNHLITVEDPDGRKIYISQKTTKKTC